MKTSPGRGRLAFAVLLLVLLVAGLAGWSFLHRDLAVPAATEVSPSQAQSARDKAAALAGAVDQAGRSGRPLTVSETFTDAELTALANDQLEARGAPIDRVTLHATGQGTIVGRARGNTAGQYFPVSFELMPAVSGDTVRFQVTQISVGSLPLPAPLANGLVDRLRQSLDVRRSVAGLHDLRVTTAEGQVTVTGVAQPS
jgi:hypothetical protein